MICRGAFLMQKDYCFLIPVIEILNQSKYGHLCDIHLTEPKLNKEWYTDTVTCLVEKLKDFLHRRYIINLQKRKVQRIFE